MKVSEALTRLVVGMSRFGDHLLSRKLSGIVVATLACAGGAGLAQALKDEPRATCAAVVPAKPADPARAEVSIRDTPTDDAEEEDAVFDKGRYENYVYGYSVEIPAGMVGAGSRPPAPQHGFGIDLDNPRSTAWRGAPEFPKSYIYLDGSYNSLEWRRLDDVVNSNLSFLREEGKNVRVRSRTATRLGGLRALRVVALYEKDGVEMVSDEIVAFGSEASPVYTLDLSTPLSKYERDRPVLEALRKSWCLQPVE
jgi:hypothetical protein